MFKKDYANDIVSLAIELLTNIRKKNDYVYKRLSDCSALYIPQHNGDFKMIVWYRNGRIEYKYFYWVNEQCLEDTMEISSDPIKKILLKVKRAAEERYA